MKADQTSSSTKLIEQFNVKWNALDERIVSVRERSLSKNGFWTGISIVGVLVSLIATFVVTYVQDYKEGLEGVTTLLKESSQRIDKIEDKIDSLGNDMIELQKQQEKSRK